MEWEDTYLNEAINDDEIKSDTVNNALKQYQESLDIENNFGGLLGKGKCLILLGRSNEATNAFVTANKEFADVGKIMKEFSKDLQKLGHGDKAFELIEIAEKIIS